MRLEETVLAATRVEAEQRFGKTGDALVAHLLKRYDDQRRARDDLGQRYALLNELHSELWAKYRRLATLLNRNGLLTTDELKEMR